VQGRQLNSIHVYICTWVAEALLCQVERQKLGSEAQLQTADLGASKYHKPCNDSSECLHWYAFHPKCHLEASNPHSSVSQTLSSPAPRYTQP